MAKRLPELCDYFMQQDISANSATIDTPEYRTGVLTAMQSLKASFFTPNTLFLSLTDEVGRDEDVATLLTKAKEYGFSAYLYVPYRKVGLGLEKTINLWIDIRDIKRDIKYKVKGFNLGLLTAYLLKRNWKARLNIIAIIKDSKNPGGEKVSASAFMKKLMILSRMPRDTQIYYVKGDFAQAVENMPYADLNILTFPEDKINIDAIRKQSDIFETSCLYARDSGQENALA